MFKQVILIMEGNNYPFGQAQTSLTASRPLTEIRTFVRKTHQTKSLHDRNLLLQKIQCIKSINSPQLIKIQSVLQQQNYVHVVYEYVPVSFQKNYDEFDDSNINSAQNQMIQLGTVLAEAGILVDWNGQSIGMRASGEIKYYLDLGSARLEKKIAPTRIQKIHYQIILSVFGEFEKEMGKGKDNKELKKYVKREEKLQFEDSKEHGYDINLLKISVENNKKAALATINARNQNQIQAKDALPAKLEIKNSQRIETSSLNSKSSNNKSNQNKNAQIMSDFLNVLSDGGEEAHSLEQADIQQFEQLGKLSGKLQCHQSFEQSSSNGEEQIIWMSHSARQDANQFVAKPPSVGKFQQDSFKMSENYANSYAGSVKCDDDLQKRAEASMRRSFQVISLFRSIVQSY